MNQKEEHRDHINSEDWHHWRNALIEERGREYENCCMDCKGKPIHLHHKNYDQDYGMEKEEKMMLLCEECHAKMHQDLEFFD